MKPFFLLLLFPKLKTLPSQDTTWHSLMTYLCKQSFEIKKKLESQLYIASVKSICSYIKLTCLCAQSWTRRVKKLLQNQHSCFLLNSAYVYLLFSLIWFKCQYRDLPQLFQRKCYRFLIVCVELILPYIRETEILLSYLKVSYADEQVFMQRNSVEFSLIA